MSVKTITKYALTVNEQINPNLTKRLKWKNCDKALIHNSSTYASSTFTKESYIKKYIEEKVTNKKTGKKETVKTPVYAWKSNHPYILTGHYFDLGIPKGSFITSVTFQVRMRGKGFKSCNVPMARFNIYGKAYQRDFDNTKKENTTGWDDGIYHVHLNKKLSSSFKTYEYTMNSANLRKGGFSIDDFNKQVMGVDLQFYNAVFDDGKVKAKKGAKYTANIDVAWVRIVVKYEIPEYAITYSTKTKQFKTGESFKLTTKYSQKTNASGGTQVLDVNIPYGTDLESYKVTGTSFNDSPTLNPDGSKTYKWTVPAKGKQSESLTMTLTPYVSGVNNITVGNKNTGQPKFTYNPVRDLTDGYDGILLGLKDTAHKGHPVCVSVDIDGYSEDDSTIYEAVVNQDVEVVDWYLDNASSDVSIAYTQGNTVMLNVPEGERYNAYLRYCFIPKTVGTNTIVVTSLDSAHRGVLSFDVQDAYEYHINLGVGNDIVLDTHRIASTLDTTAYVIPLASDDLDSLMYTSDCNISIYQWEELDYIGCVPLEHLHFDPKSTYKDKLLDTHYKNKRYMGKQLASDEDITLNVRLHPQQVTTIQGLIDMDKPIPINANHRCFESDALNHRGWAEIYGITTTLTNPHWYKCDIDVKYLTHNLNTRFKIDRGNKVNQVEVPDLMGEVVGSGDPLSHNDIVGDVTDDYFMNDTDGTYMYIEDESLEVDYLDSEGHEIIYDGTNVYYIDSNNQHIYLKYLDENNEEQFYTGSGYVDYLEENNYTVSLPLVANEPIQIITSTDVPSNQRNMFSIDNGQHITVQSRNTLANVSDVAFEWSSVLLPELEENNVERIVELVRKEDSQSIFKYQYTDFEYEYDYSNDSPIVEGVKCTVKMYIFNNGGWIDKTEEITLRSVLETGGDIVDYSDVASPVDESSDDGDMDSIDDTSELMFGSTLHLQLNNHKLKVTDEGFNGMEWVIGDDEEPINLVEGEYYWKTTWTNKNLDGESNDVVSFFDFIVNETLLNTQFAEQYGNVVVSPFPVSDKKLLFTREGEEGTIYYYQDDKEEFSYLIEPYYQYHNGTDMVTSDGVSIFNLNYGYEIIYIQNGLVRLGFDRLSDVGRIFLGKYDVKSGEYITTHNFRFDKYTDINVKSISDDKIEIQASDSIFTIWRGHPYIMVNHNGEDIWIDSKFYRVWAERVGTGDDTFEYPIYWDLMNSANLLADCVGGDKGIRSSCVEVDSRFINRQAVSLSWDGAFGEILTGDTKTFQILSPTVSVSEDIQLENYTGGFGEYSVEFEVDSTVPYKIESLTLDKFVVKPNNIDLLGRVSDYDDVGVANQPVDFYEEFTRDKLYLSSNKEYVVKDDVAKFSATLLDVDSSKISGVPVLFEADIIGSEGYKIVDFSSSKYAVVSDENTVLSVTVTDENDNPVSDVFVRFYTDIDGYEEIIYPSADVEVASISLTGNKTVLSAYDSDSLTLTATAYDSDNNPVPNKSLTFLKGSTEVKTVDTDSNGVATYTYSAEGSGDVSFTASVGSLVSETYSIRDVHYYNPCTSNSIEDYFTVPSAVSSRSIYGFNSDGWKFGNATSYQRIIATEKLSEWFNVEFTVTEMNSSGTDANIIQYIYSNGNTPNSGVTYTPFTQKWLVGSSSPTQTFTVGTRVRIEWRSGTVKVYLDDVLLGTGSHSVIFPTQVEFHTGTNRYVRIKDLIIETL